MEQDKLQTEIGNEEAIRLKPLFVTIKEAGIVEVGEKKAKKVELQCLHPESDALVKISQIKWENKGKLEVTGLWFNIDSKQLIRKGSALANFIQSNGAKNIQELVGKSLPTILDEKGYLAFKGY